MVHTVIIVHGSVSDQGQLELAIQYSVFVQLYLRKTHLFSGVDPVESSIQSVNEARGEAREGGWPAAPDGRAPSILNCRRTMAKQS